MRREEHSAQSYHLSTMGEYTPLCASLSLISQRMEDTLRISTVSSQRMEDTLRISTVSHPKVHPRYSPP